MARIVYLVGDGQFSRRKTKRGMFPITLLIETNHVQAIASSAETKVLCPPAAKQLNRDSSQVKQYNLMVIDGTIRFTSDEIFLRGHKGADFRTVGRINF